MKYIFILSGWCLPILVLACNLSSFKGEKLTAFKTIQVDILPSTGDSTVYSISLKVDSIAFRIGNEHPDGPKFFKRALSDTESNKLQRIISGLKQRENIEPELCLDCWRLQVIVDGIIFFNKSPIIKSALPMDLKQLIEFIENVSMMKIDLYSFS